MTAGSLVGIIWDSVENAFKMVFVLVDTRSCSEDHSFLQMGPFCLGRETMGLEDETKCGEIPDKLFVL